MEYKPEHIPLMESDEDFVRVRDAERGVALVFLNECQDCEVLGPVIDKVAREATERGLGITFGYAVLNRQTTPPSGLPSQLKRNLGRNLLEVNYLPRTYFFVKGESVHDICNKEAPCREADYIKGEFNKAFGISFD